MADDASGDRSTDSMSAAPRVVFIHIPKTGGTTLKQVLSSNTRHSMRLGNVFKGGGGRAKEPDYERMVGRMNADVRARFFWGHTPFAIASYMPPQWETNFITFLRDPADRAISQYYGMVDRLNVPRTDSSDDAAGVDRAFRGAARKRWVIRGEFSLDTPYEVALADAAFVSDNLQTRMLCGQPRPFGEVTDEMLERAIENLGRFRCVGLTERFDESLVLLKQRIGYQHILYGDQRVNTSRPRDAGVPEDLRRAAEEANRFDRELYRHAVATFETAPELRDLDFRIDLAALRSSRGSGEAPLPDPPPELGPEGPCWPELLAERRSLLGATPRAKRNEREIGMSSAAGGNRGSSVRELPPKVDVALAGPMEATPGRPVRSLVYLSAMSDAPGSDPRAERGRRKKGRRQAPGEQNAGPVSRVARRRRKPLRDEQAQGLAATQEEREPLIAFVHIPKTAGGTVKSVFADSFGRGAVSDSGNYLRNPELTAAQSFPVTRRVRITIGHVPYGLYRPNLPPDTRYITFLREPVERVISHYYRHLDGKVGTRTLTEALESGSPALTNLLTRFLCGHGHPEVLGDLPDTAVEDAKAALETFFFVGFQDRFDESLVLLQERLGMPMTAYGASRHVNAERPSFEQVGEENLALIATHNQLDAELYAWARDRFGGDFEARRDDLGVAVETLRSAVKDKVAEQMDRTARAAKWLAEQVPPGTQRPFKELRTDAEKVGLTTRDVQRARRQMNPPARKIKTDSGVMLAVAPVPEAVDHATRKAAKKKQRIEVATSPEARAATAAATRWLEEQLPPGTSRRIGELLDAAEQVGVPADAVRRAAQEMGLRRRVNDAGAKVWTAGDVAAAGVLSGAHE